MPSQATGRLLRGERANFGTLLRAAAAGQLALVQVTEKTTGCKRAAICAINHDGKTYEMVPLALMVDGNPYELFDPPAPGTTSKPA